MRTNPRYSESAALMPRPHGWQSQTPTVSHVHTARRMKSEVREMPGRWGGLTRRPMGCLWQALQSRRCLSRMTAGAGGFIAQFCPSAMVSVLGLQAGRDSRREGERTWGRLYPANDRTAFAALGDHVSRTAPRLATVAGAPRYVFHVIPVARPGAVAERRLGIDRRLLVGAVEGRLDQDRPVLQQGVVNAPTGAR